MADGMRTAAVQAAVRFRMSSVVTPPGRDPPADGVLLIGAELDEPGAAAEGVRRAGHRLDGDRTAALPWRKGVAGADLNVVGTFTEPHVRAERTRRVGQAHHGPAVRVPVEVAEGGVQLERTDGSWRSQVVLGPCDRLDGNGQAAFIGAQPRPGGDGQHRPVDDGGARGDVGVLAETVGCGVRVEVARVV